MVKFKKGDYFKVVDDDRRDSYNDSIGVTVITDNNIHNDSRYKYVGKLAKWTDEVTKPDRNHYPFNEKEVVKLSEDEYMAELI